MHVTDGCRLVLLSTGRSVATSPHHSLGKRYTIHRHIDVEQCTEHHGMNWDEYTHISEYKAE